MARVERPHGEAAAREQEQPLQELESGAEPRLERVLGGDRDAVNDSDRERERPAGPELLQAQVLLPEE